MHSICFLREWIRNEVDKDGLLNYKVAWVGNDEYSSLWNYTAFTFDWFSLLESLKIEPQFVF